MQDYQWIIWKDNFWVYESIPLLKDAFIMIRDSWLFEYLKNDPKFVYSTLIRLQQIINDWENHRAINMVDWLLNWFNLIDNK